MSNTIVLTGGGTAGHVMPNIALLPNLEKHFDKICYIGSRNGIEKKLIQNIKNIDYFEIDSVKLIRKLTLKNIAIPFVLLKAIRQSIKILKKLQPKVIFSKGGYVAVPVVIAGSILKIPIIAHESDSSIGLANKIIYKKCDTMFFSFEEAMKGYEKKGVYSGSPIRQEFLHCTKKYNINIDQNKKTIVVVGGSLGSVALNNTIVEALPKLQNYNIINIVGNGKINNNIYYPNYFQIEFVDDIASLYNIADIVISRAGSNAIFELLAMQKPMILIPLPKDESRGDQIINAKIFGSKGFAIVILQENLTTDLLLDKIQSLEKNKNKFISTMSRYPICNSNNIIVQKLSKYI